MWWNIFLSFEFWIGYTVGFVIALVCAWIVSAISYPYGVVTLKTYGDIDAIANTVRQALEELMRKYGNSPDTMYVTVNPTLNGREYLFRYVIVNYINDVKVYPTYNYSNNKEVMIYIQGLDRWEIKMWLKKSLKAS
ncbi:MAG: hypothetical protein RXQ98_09325 [Sulfolobaceae archaeon]